MHFEWDPLKNLSNALKHGIRFEEAQEAFDDPHQILIDDWEHSKESEKRFRLIGKIEEIVIAVAFTYRRHFIRIISARPAHRHERNVYEERKE